MWRHFHFCDYIIDLLQLKAAKMISLLLIITLSFPRRHGIVAFRCCLQLKYVSVVSNAAIAQLCVWTNKKVAAHLSFFTPVSSSECLSKPAYLGPFLLRPHWFVTRSDFWAWFLSVPLTVTRGLSLCQDRCLCISPLKVADFGLFSPVCLKAFIHFCHPPMCATQ